MKTVIVILKTMGLILVVWLAHYSAAKDDFEHGRHRGDGEHDPAEWYRGKS